MLCKNCPLNGIRKEGGDCIAQFISKFQNSCVTYNIDEESYPSELESFCAKHKNVEVKKAVKKDKPKRSKAQGTKVKNTKKKQDNE